MSDKLWSDERIEKSLRTWAATSVGRIDYTGLLRLLRDEYEAELSRLRAENERLRAAVEWEPVLDGKYDVGKGYVYDVSESGRRIRRRVDEFPAGTLWLPYKQGWCLMRRRQPQEAKQVE